MTIDAPAMNIDEIHRSVIARAGRSDRVGRGRVIPPTPIRNGIDDPHG
jgi:hypothetical protein